jgi:UDP-N-acetylmuramate--alanine ligase
MFLGPLTQRVRNIHFIGIGGAGMSGIAEILMNVGFAITGSDIMATEVTGRLESLGARVFIGHDATNVASCDVVVYSSAVKMDNPEILAARERMIPVIGRPEMLAEIMRMKYGICIAGTHGKTSTTTMVGRVLSAGGIDPTIIVGGKVAAFGGGAKAGDSNYLVLEADEYDRTFLRLTPVIAAVTTVDLEHLDCYRDIDDIEESFTTFCNKVPFFGSVILCIDDPGVKNIMPGIDRNILTYGVSRQADVRADDICQEGMITRFTLIINGERCGEINLGAPGLYNVRNALAACAIADLMGVPFDTMAEALGSFTSVGRRFELKGEAAGVMVIDDYAHHPTEIIASLEGARSGFDRRIIAVFQPHLFSRTRDFQEEFGQGFMDADILLVTDVYASRESAIEGVTGKLVADAALAAGHRNVTYEPDKRKLPELLKEIVQENDLVITYGAGDIHKAGSDLLAALGGTE